MNDLQLHIIHSKRQPIGSDWDDANVCSSYWRLYINNRDGASLRLTRSVYPLPAGHIHLIPAYVRFSCVNTTPVDHYYIHFDLLGLTPLLQKSLFVEPLSMPLTHTSHQVLSCHKRGQTTADSPELLFLTQTLVLESLAHAFAGLTPGKRTQLIAAFAVPSPVQPAIRLLEQILPAAPCVADLADACSMSEDHFIRRFRQAVGQTPARYVLQRRLALAARQLLYTTDSIETIATRHQFSNRFHFTRAFSREMGIPPAAYRSATRV